jgi:molybdenum cofactor biosynthesis protein B
VPRATGELIHRIADDGHGPPRPRRRRRDRGDRHRELDAHDAVITTGGTGITADDVTIDVIARLLDVELPGFGELFRARSVAEIGTRAIGTRALAGIRGQTVLVAVPGSEGAATLGGELIMPELAHLVGLRRRPVDDDGV